MMKLIVDRTLGKLAKNLRILGFDTEYWHGGSLAGAVKTAATQGRILLTRSHRLEKAGGIRIVVIEANDPREQILETVSKLNLQPEEERFFSRCLLCNESLQSIPKEAAEGKVPDFIYQAYDIFHSCPKCRRLYWPGTHLRRMKEEFAPFSGRH